MRSRKTQGPVPGQLRPGGVALRHIEPRPDDRSIGLRHQVCTKKGENATLKRMCADLTLMHHALKEVVARKR